MWFLWENCRGVKRSKHVTMLRFITGNCEDLCSPFSVESLTNAFLLPTAWLLKSQGDASRAPSSRNLLPFQPSLHWRPGIATHSLCEHLQEGEEDASPRHGRQSCLFPGDRIFSSGDMCYFLLQIFLRRFFTVSASSTVSL